MNIVSFQNPSIIEIDFEKRLKEVLYQCLEDLRGFNPDFEIFDALFCHDEENYYLILGSSKNQLDFVLKSFLKRNTHKDIGAVFDSENLVFYKRKYYTLKDFPNLKKLEQHLATISYL